jgi:hypothetical protein
MTQETAELLKNASDMLHTFWDRYAKNLTPIDEMMMSELVSRIDNRLKEKADPAKLSEIMRANVGMTKHYKG